MHGSKAVRLVFKDTKVTLNLLFYKSSFLLFSNYIQSHFRVYLPLALSALPKPFFSLYLCAYHFLS